MRNGRKARYNLAVVLSRSRLCWIGFLVIYEAKQHLDWPGDLEFMGS